MKVAMDLYFTDEFRKALSTRFGRGDGMASRNEIRAWATAILRFASDDILARPTIEKPVQDESEKLPSLKEAIESSVENENDPCPLCAELQVESEAAPKKEAFSVSTFRPEPWGTGKA